MIVISTYWGIPGSRRGAVVCLDEQGYYVRYAHNMRVIRTSKRYKRNSTCVKKALAYCNGLLTQ